MIIPSNKKAPLSGYHPRTQTSKQKKTKELTSKPNSDHLSDPYVTTRWGVNGIPIYRSHIEVSERRRWPLVRHPGGEHPGGPMGRHLEDSSLGSRRYPGGRIRPPNSYQDLITTPQQLVGKGCVRSWYYEVIHVQDMVHLGSICPVLEEALDLSSQDEPIHLKFPPQFIQKVNTT